MKAKQIAQLRETDDYLTEWISRTQQAYAEIPGVRRLKADIDLQIVTLENQPEEADQIPLGNLEQTIDIEQQYILEHIQMPPKVMPVSIASATAITASGTAGVYEYVSRVGELNTQATIVYENEFLTRYHSLQQHRNQTETIRSIIRRMSCPGSLERFERALSFLSTVLAGSSELTAAAMEIRTLLDGIQGDLFALARQWPKENMTWDSMIKRLSGDYPDGPKYQTLYSQQQKRSALILKLSEIGKDRVSASPSDLEEIWVQVLEHLYIVLTLTGFRE